MFLRGLCVRPINQLLSPFSIWPTLHHEPVKFSRITFWSSVQHEPYLHSMQWLFYTLGNRPANPLTALLIKKIAITGKGSSSRLFNMFCIVTIDLSASKREIGTKIFYKD